MLGGLALSGRRPPKVFGWGRRGRSLPVENSAYRLDIGSPARLQIWAERSFEAIAGPAIPLQRWRLTQGLPRLNHARGALGEFRQSHQSLPLLAIQVFGRLLPAPPPERRSHVLDEGGSIAG